MTSCSTVRRALPAIAAVALAALHAGAAGAAAAPAVVLTDDTTFRVDRSTSFLVDAPHKFVLNSPSTRMPTAPIGGEPAEFKPVVAFGGTAEQSAIVIDNVDRPIRVIAWRQGRIAPAGAAGAGVGADGRFFSPGGDWVLPPGRYRVHVLSGGGDVTVRLRTALPGDPTVVTEADSAALPLPAHRFHTATATSAGPLAGTFYAEPTGTEDHDRYFFSSWIVGDVESAAVVWQYCQYPVKPNQPVPHQHGGPCQVDQPASALGLFVTFVNPFAHGWNRFSVNTLFGEGAIEQLRANRVTWTSSAPRTDSGYTLLTIANRD